MTIAERNRRIRKDASQKAIEGFFVWFIIVATWHVAAAMWFFRDLLSAFMVLIIGTGLVGLLRTLDRVKKFLLS